MSNADNSRMTGVIEARFGWNAFPKQHSGGLIGGLTSRNTAVDCDARAIFCGKDGRPISFDIKECCAAYDNRVMYNNAVIHNGDNQTGGSDAECITFDLKRIPSDIDHIILSLDLLKEKKKTGFGRIQEAYLRLYYKDTGEEITEADFGHLNSDTRIVVAGRLKFASHSSCLGLLFSLVAECVDIRCIWNRWICYYGGTCNP